MNRRRRSKIHQREDCFRDNTCETSQQGRSLVTCREATEHPLVSPLKMNLKG
ncbi:hypothetical protein LguiB_017793 [Lonicera macranthoides]